MTERDLARVLTQSVQGVHLSDTARRSIRQATKEERPMKRKTTVALALVMAMMLLAGGALAVASGTGMLDFLNRKMGQTVLPGAEEIVQSDIAHGETDHIIYHVKQAVYDGKSVSLLVEMQAKDEKTFLITEGYCLNDRYGSLAYNTEAEMLSDPRTIEEYARENGYTQIMSANMHFDIGSDIACVEEWKANVLTVMYSFRAEGDVLTLPATYSEFNVETGTAQHAQGEIVLTATEPLWTVSSEQTFSLPEYGIRIEGMTVTGTMLQSYWAVHFTITDAAKAEGFHWFDLLSAEGETLPRGVLGVGGSKIPSDIDEQHIWTGGFGAVSAAPEQLMLRIRDLDGIIDPVQMIFDLK